jgi:hypothetical protein
MNLRDWADSAQAPVFTEIPSVWVEKRFATFREFDDALDTLFGCVALDPIGELFGNDRAGWELHFEADGRRYKIRHQLVAKIYPIFGKFELGLEGDGEWFDFDDRHQMQLGFRFFDLRLARGAR